MRLTPEFVDDFYQKDLRIRRRVWQDGDHLMPDGAEGGTLWYYNAATDELTKGYGIGFNDLAADDWEFHDAD